MNGWQLNVEPKKWMLTDGPNAVTFEDRGSKMRLESSFLNYGGRMQWKPARWLPKEQARQEWRRRLLAAGWVEWK